MRFREWWGRRRATVAERHAKAEAARKKMEKKGGEFAPIRLTGKTIAHTFWGKSWCSNLESYSDYENRLPRGRSYLRSGSVLHLDIGEGVISARVMGSSLYKVAVKIAPVGADAWQSICHETAGTIDSLVELLQGRFDRKVMERVCRQESGLFPAPRDMKFSCSCPDSANMCKHVAAVMYGVGARLDERPELLFRLRKVDEKEMVAGADAGLRLGGHRTGGGSAGGRILEGADLDELFGLQLGGGVRGQRAGKKAVGSGKKRGPVPARRPAKKKTAGKPVSRGGTRKEKRVTVKKSVGARKAKGRPRKK